MASAAGPQWIDDKRLVRPHHLEAFSRWVRDSPVIVLDYEGDGLEARRGHRSFMAGVYAPDKGARVVDFRLTGEAGKRALADALRARTGITIGHNLKHELSQSWAEGWEIGGQLWDNQAAAFALNEKLKSTGQKALVHDMLKRATPFADALHTWMELNLGTSKRGHELNPNELEVPYNIEDVTDAWDLYCLLRPQVEKAGMLQLVLTDSELCRPVAEMEDTGMAYDGNHAEVLIKDFSAKRAAIYKRISASVGRPIDVSSHATLFGLLYGEYKLPLHKDLEKEGSLDDDVLKWMVSLKTARTPLIQDIRDWRELDKLLGTYLLPWTYEHQYKGHLFGNLNSCGPETRRFSADSPNLQNIPHRTVFGDMLRECFLTLVGWQTYSFDYSQVEYRMFAHYAGEPRLVQGYRTNPLFDIHAEVGLLINMLRDLAKHINFGILYGMGLDKLARKLGVSKDAAKAILDEYHKKIPSAKALKKRLEDLIRRSGFVATALGGRRHLTLDEAYKALNTLCQMSGADLMRRALVRTYPIVKAAGGKMTITIHDEVQFKLPGNDWREHIPTLKKVKAAMEDNPEFTVPMIAACDRYAPNWAHMEGIDLAVA